MKTFKKFIEETYDPSIIHVNPTIKQIKKLARNSDRNRLRFVITKHPDNKVYVGDARRHVHVTLIPNKERWHSIGFINHRNGKFEYEHHGAAGVGTKPEPHEFVKILKKSGINKEKLNEDKTEDYRGEHQAPDKESGSPLHDVTKNETYPKDFYGHNGFRYYSDYGGEFDRESHNKVLRLKNRPDHRVWVHRAIPKEVYKKELKKQDIGKHKNSIAQRIIHPGSWVTISRKYAHEHGKANLGGKGKYKIVSNRVPAKHVFTSGDSIHEWGYDPS